VVQQCRHNYFRAGAGLGLLEWDDALADFATEHAKYLRDSNYCSMRHSSSDQRKNIDGWGYVGENLYWYWTCPYGDGIALNDFPTKSQDSVDAWYEEIKFYQWSSQSFDACPMRNNDNGDAQVGHFTQLMWEGTTHLGCDYATCGSSDNTMVIVCEYGPGGNMQGEQAFSNEARSALNKWSENAQYGGLKRGSNLGLDC
jgi:pathogenesis-related protein 1